MLFVKKFVARVRDRGLTVALIDTGRFISTRLTFQFRTALYRLGRKARTVAVASEVAGDRPWVTFVVPVYDREQMLIDCIQSIWAQGYPRTEIVVVLDGSPSGTVAVARSLAAEDNRLRLIELPTQSGNAVMGRNIGIAQAKGEFVFFLDSDDLCLPGRIEETLSAFAAPHVDAVYGGYFLRFEDDPGKSHAVAPSDISFDVVREINPIANSTVAIRRSALSTHGMLKREMQYREDHELWLRLCFGGCVFRRIPALLSEIRIHGENNESAFRDRDAHHFHTMMKCYFLPGPKPVSIIFVLPGLGLSGGIYVVLRHANALAELGLDVAVMVPNPDEPLDWYPHTNHVRIIGKSKADLDRADIAFATGWQTAHDVMESAASKKAYFVQSDETRFVDDVGMSKVIAQTYRMPFWYLTEARWIISWLRSQFGWQASYVPNGVEQTLFRESGEVLEPRSSRPRVLIEGPIVIPWKGVEDAYKAVAGLDCEIWLVSSAGAPPDHWKIDRFFERVPMAEMGAIYRSCDIFVKMSRVEGFFGPPLEAMACGCAVVVSEVTGADEFIINGENALVAPMHDIAAVRGHVKRLIDDLELRNQLVKRGYETVRDWGWNPSFAAMARFIEMLI